MGGSVSGGGPLNVFGAASEAGEQDKATDQRLRKTLNEWRPERFAGLFEEYLPIYERIHAPALTRATDMAAIRGQNRENAFGTLVGRRGLAGSGADIFGRAAVAGQTSAEQNTALLDFYQRALSGAEKNARETRAGRAGAKLETPITHEPSTSGTAASMLGAGAPTATGK